MAEEKKKAPKAAKKETPKKKPVVRKKKEAAIYPAPAPAAVQPAPAYAPAAPKWPLLPKGPRYYGTGRRKEAAAKVWLVPGKGKVEVNGKSLLTYFCGRRILEFFISRPFEVTKTAGNYDVYAQVFGGGVPSQANAVGLGIARALVVLNPDLKTALKRQGLMTRDPRMKERKKYGLKRARRAFQYTKR